MLDRARLSIAAPAVLALVFPTAPANSREAAPDTALIFPNLAL